MSQYELTVLLEKEDYAKAVKTLLGELKIKIDSETGWGKKTLAYPIKKHHNMYYFIWKISGPAAQLPELKKKLNFDETIVRYLLLKLN
ncbi:30S ribosomal protein S6 [Patescibacteria group bacterium]|nr:30S ribosomal protein S6 [Patescibacteria group bacterium]MCL5091808.1 30S ribosomal protein S6 [Patescibacteria group bacterium]